MSAPVDVLAVMDAEIARERERERSAEERGASFGIIDPIRVRIAKLEKSRAAIAELIEASRRAIEALDEDYGRDGMSDEEIYDAMPSSRVALAYFAIRNALARVTPMPPEQQAEQAQVRG